MSMAILSKNALSKYNEHIYLEKLRLVVWSKGSTAYPCTTYAIRLVVDIYKNLQLGYKIQICGTHTDNKLSVPKIYIYPNIANANYDTLG